MESISFPASILSWLTIYCVQVLCRGRHVFMGYLGMEEKTKDVIDDEGWLHSGDIGRLDKVSCIV